MVGVSRCFPRALVWAALGCCFACLGGPVAAAQDAPEGGLPPTLRVQSRLVVEDLLVTDAKGNPVHGLPRSAFHVTDQGQPQTIKSFEEGAPEAVGTGAAPVEPLRPAAASDCAVAAGAAGGGVSREPWADGADSRNEHGPGGSAAGDGGVPAGDGDRCGQQVPVGD